MKKWYKLDAFAKTYSSIMSEGRTTCFRLSILLREEVDKSILIEASQVLKDQYDFFNSELKKGIFWNYLQHKDSDFTVIEEKTYPCTDIRRKEPLRIIYYKNKISIEIAHFLTDGTGAAEFLKDLAKVYIDLKYDDEKLLELKRNRDLIVSKEDKYIDLYSKYLKKVSRETTVKKAFHFPYKRSERGHYYVTTGEMYIEDVKREAKVYNTTIGKYMLATYFKVILDTYENMKDQVVVGVPVDLRNIYKEKTYRNFFINITPSIDPTLGAYSLEEIIKYLDSYFELKITKKEFFKSIYKAMNPVSNRIVKIVPYFIKKMLFPFIFDYYGERGYTTGFSNLGIFDIDGYEQHFQGLRFVPPPSKRCKIKVGIVSDKDKLYFTFGNLTNNYELEKNYFRYLKRHGITSKIITNYERG